MNCYARYETEFPNTRFFTLCYALGTVAMILASAGSTTAAMADGPTLEASGLHYYLADGETLTGLADAHYAVVDVYADFNGANDGYDREDAELLRLYEVNVAVDGISNFNHDDLASGAGGSWEPSVSFDIPEMANSRIDSFLTIGGGVGSGAVGNTTELLGKNTSSSSFIYGEDIAWQNSTPANLQGAADMSLRVLVGRFVISGEDFRACGSLEMSGELEYSYGDGSPLFSAEVAMTVALLGCESSECTGDINEDGAVDGADLAQVLGSWGQTGGSADVNDDGLVDGADLATILGQWGACS